MEVATFFNGSTETSVTSFNDISEESLLSVGRFSKEQIADLFSCLEFQVEKLSASFWALNLKTSNKFSSIEDEKLMNVGVLWSDCGSWDDTPVNSMDLAGCLLELKYNLLKQNEQKCILVLFEHEDFEY